MKTPQWLCLGFGICLLAGILDGDFSAALKSADYRIAPGPVTVMLKAQRADGKPSPVASAVVHIGGRYASTGNDGLTTFDGIPAGDYQLLIEHPGFERFASTLKLPEGKREELKIILTPETLVDVKGMVTEDGGRPLVGAWVKLTPLKVPASVQGLFEFGSGWGGEFLALDVPSGTYRADVSCAGCRENSLEIEVAAGMAELKFSLVRLYSPASLDATVIDSDSGQPVGGARVILAEAWPKGLIAEAQTDAAGRARFGDIKVGDLNWPDEKGNLSICRPQVTIRAEAEGYEPMIIPATLVESTAATVKMNSRRPMRSDGANASLQQAMAIRTGCPVEFNIPKRGDNRFFRFRLAYPADAKFMVGPANPIEIHVRILASDGKLITEKGTYTGQDNIITLRLGSGEYYVQIMEWGNDNASPQPLTLTVNVEHAADALEPNDSAETGRLIRRNQEVRGRIWPTGDRDFFRYEVKRPGWYRFTMPPANLERHLAVLDERGQRVAERGVYTNQSLELAAQLGPGPYTIAVLEWGNDNSSLDPYSLRVEACEDDGLDDPPDRGGRPAAARVMNLNRTVSSTINPVGESDTYALSIPSAGVLHIQGRYPIELHVRLLSNEGRMLAEQGVYSNRPLHFTRSFETPTTVYVRVFEWGSDNWSPYPYRIFAWFEPCDELDFTGRNDSAETAIPALIGETIRGSINPVRDVDVFSLTADHSGYLKLDGIGQTELHLRVVDGAGKMLAERGTYTGQRNNIRIAVPPGEYKLEVHEWGEDGRHSGGYAVQTALERAEPEEIVPLARDAIRPLALGRAESFAFDQLGDMDRFLLNVPNPGKFTLRFVNPLELLVRVFDDQTQALVRENGFYTGRNPFLELEAKGPTRYRVELQEWGNDGASLTEGYILADEKARTIGADRVTAAADPFDPTLVKFTRTTVEGLAAPAKTTIDVTGDGRPDFDLPSGAAGASWRFPAEGLYKAAAIMENPDGVSARHLFWVEAVGQTERKGVFLVVDYPYEGQIIDRDLPCRARAVSFGGAKIRSVSLAVDGSEIGRAYSIPYEIEVPWRSLGGGSHALTLTAVDASGEKAVVKRTVKLSEYFDLQPQDNAVLSGNSVRVSWTGKNFGQAVVRYSLKGGQEWKTAVGQNDRIRTVPLSDLEPGQAYEFQPDGGGEPGPLRTVTRVKGLAFGRPRYGATIKRDYDQRLGISVRNHADKPLTVRLECGQVAEESRLLVGFVGEGSEGAPFVLKPGEERDFLLGISAQDVIQAAHRFPIRIASESGFNDEAEVELNVILPNVRLEWEPAGDKPIGIGKIIRLRNKGDGLTDLTIESDTADIILSPAVQHSVFPPGATMEIAADARLYEGFRSVEGKITARAVDKQISTDVRIALKEGQILFDIPLVPGHDPSGTVSAESEIRAARAIAGAYLDASTVDWSRKERPEDVDGDGRADRWFVDDPAEDTFWVGDDTDGDGDIDFVHADIGKDGVFDYSAIESKTGWEPTNLVEAWLEMGFSLPWARGAYEKHDVDVVINGVVIGKLREAVPEGNYTFRIPSSVLKFNAAGELEANRIEIQTRHLRGGHYVVTSNFNIRYRVTGTRLWIAAGTREEATKIALASPGLVMTGPDYSLSSAEMRLDGPSPPAKGTEVGVVLPVRNVGATGVRSIPVVLMVSAPGAPGVVIARDEIQDVPLLGSKSVRLPWKAAAGTHTLRVVVDPDNLCGDVDRSNNEALLTVTVPGDDAKPVVKISEPADGSALKTTITAVKAEAEDDGGVSLVEARVDNGLWTKLSGDKTFEGTALLQPGPHAISVRATDGSGNQVEQTIKVTVDVKAPEVRILMPERGSTIDTRRQRVKVQSDAGAALVALRINGGPWMVVKNRDGIAETEVTLPFGRSTIEAAAVNETGAMGRADVEVTCTKQPDPQEQVPGPAPEIETGVIEVKGLGPLDMFGPANRILGPTAGRRVDRMSDRRL